MRLSEPWSPSRLAEIAFGITNGGRAVALRQGGSPCHMRRRNDCATIGGGALVSFPCGLGWRQKFLGIHPPGFTMTP